MFKKTALVAGIGLALSVTAQADYRWELGGDYTMGQTDTEVKIATPVPVGPDNVDSDVGRLSGTWYMENVDTSKGPLSEAAFLDHASNITVFGSDGEVQLSQIGDTIDLMMKTASATALKAATSPKARAGSCPAGWWTWATTTSNRATQEIDNFNVGIGNYLTPNTTLVANYGNTSVNNGGDTDALFAGS